MAAGKKKPAKLDIRFDYNNVLAERVGSKDGLSDAAIERLARRTPKIAARLAAQRAAGKLPYRDLPYQEDQLRAIQRSVRARKGKFDNVVVLGIGGSALGARAVHTACRRPFVDLLSEKDRQWPRLFVMDNIDPAHFAALMDTIDPGRSLFVPISKSGSTAETMSQLMICRDLLKKRLGNKYARNIVAITGRSKGPLRQIAEAEGYETFAVPDGVGGRFSVLSPVGLFPLAMVGINIRQLLAGAAAMDARCKATNLRRNPAFMSAAVQYLYYLKGKPLSVMMPYSQALGDVADWYRQLWAESLGKIRTRGGRKEFVGPTPIKALGVTDQHSQVQLYRQGPKDKIFTLLAVEDFGREVKIPKILGDVQGCGYLGGHTMGELMDAERRATVYALTRSGRPNVTVTLPVVSEHTVGQLLYMLEVQTSLAGELLGVNTYNQPGVEEGKIATYALMGRKGYAETRREIRRLKASPKYVI
ncbi:MAG: glucose-6-phosphate isomerase [Anaerolineaceae bacterium]|nr:glucose-6-phosphate isomerase [Anaerolineaceae bacterium]